MVVAVVAVARDAAQHGVADEEVARERREVVGDRLHVADVREHGLERDNSDVARRRVVASQCRGGKPRVAMSRCKPRVAAWLQAAARG